MGLLSLSLNFQSFSLNHYVLNGTIVLIVFKCFLFETVKWIYDRSFDFYSNEITEYNRHHIREQLFETDVSLNLLMNISLYVKKYIGNCTLLSFY